MSQEDFETLALDLLEATMNIASIHKVDEKRLLEELKRQGPLTSHAACIAYAFRSGIKTAFDAWSVLQKGHVKQKVGNITILGGGCCFELPVLMQSLRHQNKELFVKIIDPVSKWKIFHPMHVRLAEKMGLRLHLDYVPVVDLLEQIDSYKTDLLVSFNALDDLKFSERKAMRIAHATCNRHLIWHPSLSVMQDVFSASFIPMRDEMECKVQDELSEFFSRRYPKLSQLNLFANLGKKGFYLMHKLNEKSSTERRHYALPTGSFRSG